MEDTIAACATPPGEGGVAIIRISGKEAVKIGDKVFSGCVTNFDSHRAYYGNVINSKGNRVDDALMLVMRAPRSYTGEDTVEIQCHGGSLITRKVLEVVLQAGARLAMPGEFTKRAFLNQKLDLAQAEAVQELISAKNSYALDAAENQLQGKLTKLVTTYQNQLTKTAAILEAWVDFPEEDIAFGSLEELSSEIETTTAAMQRLVDTFHDGKILHDGLSLCLVGCPNVGKSSLMNALLDKERAIVSHIPGTTRDLVEDHISLNGLNIKLTDTAGIRDADEIIEREGIRRSKNALEKADIVLLVLDASRDLTEEDQALISLVPEHKTLVVWNKMDLPDSDCQELPISHISHISAKELTGIDSLKEKLNKIIWDHGPPSKEEILITKLRHKEALEEAIDASKKVTLGLRQGVSPEFLSMDMRSALSALGKIIGTDITEDILSSIFSQFCIGK